MIKRRQNYEKYGQKEKVRKDMGEWNNKGKKRVSQRIRKIASKIMII